MTQLLIRLFIRDYKNTHDPTIRNAYGKLAGLVGILCNLLLGGGKVVTGLLFSSIAVLADGINNLSDATSSVTTLICFRLSARPADKKHPFGYARMEYISGLVISFLIMFVGFDLAKSSFEKILHPVAITFSWLSVGILIISILLKAWMMLFYRHVGDRIHSTAITAAATDSRNDVVATVAVLLTTLLFQFTGVLLDGWGGLGIALFILYSGIMLIKDTLSPLLGEAPDLELVENTKKQILSYEGVLGIHDLVVHDYGPGRVFASVHVEVNAHVDILQSHDLCDTIEQDFEKKGLHLVVHMDPLVIDDEKLNRLRADVCQLVAALDAKLTLHDFRMVRGYTHTNIIFDLVLSADCRFSETELRERLQKEIHSLDPDANYQTVIEIDRDYSPRQ